MAILPRLVVVAAVCLCTAVGLATCDQLQYSNTALVDVLKRVLPEATAAPQLSIVPVQGAGHGLAITDQGGTFNSPSPPTTRPTVVSYKPCPSTCACLCAAAGVLWLCGQWRKAMYWYQSPGAAV